MEKLLVPGSSVDGAEELEKRGYDGGNLIDIMIDDGSQADRSGEGRVLNEISQCSHRKLKRVLGANCDDVQTLRLRYESRGRKQLGSNRELANLQVASELLLQETPVTVGQTAVTIGQLLSQGKLHPEVGVFELCSLK